MHVALVNTFDSTVWLEIYWSVLKECSDDPTDSEGAFLQFRSSFILFQIRIFTTYFVISPALIGIMRTSNRNEKWLGVLNIKVSSQSYLQ